MDREAAQLRFRGSLDRLRNCDGFLTMMRESFGATALSENNSPYLFGRFRNGDPEIGALLITKLGDRFSGRPLRILELGMGCTYGEFVHRGSPWLSRCMKEAFGSQIEITVSDHASRGAQLFFRTEDAVLHSVNLPDGLKRGDLEIGSYEQGEILTPRYSTWEQIARTRSAEKFLRTEINLALGKGIDEPIPPQTPIFLRPAIDTEFEERVFGIRAIAGVDYNELLESFPQQRFDLIFLRHLPPALALRHQSILRSAEKVITPTGVAVVFGDW